MSNWHTSSYSSGGANCVEVAETPHQALIRDTQHPHLGHLQVPAAEWRAFLTGLRQGELE